MKNKKTCLQEGMLDLNKLLFDMVKKNAAEVQLTLERGSQEIVLTITVDSVKDLEEKSTSEEDEPIYDENDCCNFCGCLKGTCSSEECGCNICSKRRYNE